MVVVHKTIENITFSGTGRAQKKVFIPFGRFLKELVAHLPVVSYPHLLDNIINSLEQALSIPQYAMAGQGSAIEVFHKPMMMVGIRTEIDGSENLTDLAKQFISHVKKCARDEVGKRGSRIRSFSQEKIDEYFESFSKRDACEKKVLFNYLVGNYYLLVDVQRDRNDESGIIRLAYSIETQANQLRKTSPKYAASLAREEDKNIHSVIQKMIAELGKHWEGVSVYLFDGKQLKIADRNRGSLKASTYVNWSDPSGIAKKVLDEYIRYGVTALQIDLQSELQILNTPGREHESCVSKPSIEEDYKRFMLDEGNPGSMLVKLIIKPGAVGKKEGWTLDDVLGLVYLDNRLLRSDIDGNIIANIYPAIRYKPPTSPAEYVNDVVGQLRQLILVPTAKAIENIIARNIGQNIRAIISAESPVNNTDGVHENRQPSSPKLPVITEILPAVVPAVLTHSYSDSSLNDDFLGYKIEVNNDPALNYGEDERIRERVVKDAQALATAAIGQTPTAQEMTDHLIKVSVSETVRDKDGSVVAFGTSRYFDGYVNNRGEREKLTLLWGTMVHPDHRRKGWLIKLNYDLIRAAKNAVAFTLKGVKIFKRPFVAAPMVVRTQNKAVWDACNRHFAGVTMIGAKPGARYQHMIKYAADKQGWIIDELNIQRGAYSSKRVDNEKDLISGLGPNDAYVFAGDFTAWRAFLTKIIVDIYYPLRSYFKNRRKLNK